MPNFTYKHKNCTLNCVLAATNVGYVHNKKPRIIPQLAPSRLTMNRRSPSHTSLVDFIDNTTDINQINMQSKMFCPNLSAFPPVNRFDRLSCFVATPSLCRTQSPILCPMCVCRCVFALCAVCMGVAIADKLISHRADMAKVRETATPPSEDDELASDGSGLEQL
jgi:hypothetical protein